jgi:hypothetical protein
MHLIRPESARIGVQGRASATEWPHYLKFVGLISFDCVAIGPAEVLHGDLLLWIRNAVESASGSRLEFRDVDVFDGYIEFESDTDLVVRTMDGKSLNRAIELEIRRLLQELEE